MSVEVRPYGAKCNLHCHYCYQNPERDSDKQPDTYDLTLIKRQLDRAGKPFALFGGEPLLMPVRDLEELFKFGFEKFGSTSIQTNGTLINSTHIDLFKKYNVSVSMSIDGPAELNDMRFISNLTKTRHYTQKTETAIDLLCENEKTPSLIITLHRGNATADKLAGMNNWITELDSKGIRAVRLHILETESELIRQTVSLTSEENIKAFKNFYELEKSLTNIKFDIYRDIRLLLIGEDEKVSCVWKACDPYTTRAVQGIEGNGQMSNCGRTYKEGVGFIKSNSVGFERYTNLYSTPQDEGGCKGCDYFFACKGQCPGTGIDTDWRNKSEHCETWKVLFGLIENEFLEKGLTPISKSVLKNKVEEELLQGWNEGRNQSLSDAVKTVKIKEATRVKETTQDEKEKIYYPKTRIVWATEHLKSVWENRIEKIREMLREIDIAFVLKGQKQCGAFWVTKEEFEKINLSLKEEIRIKILQDETKEQKKLLFIAVGRASALDKFVKQITNGKSENNGSQIGYPNCCWQENEFQWSNGVFDLTWNYYSKSKPAFSEQQQIEITDWSYSQNILWSALGLRITPHIPCSFYCNESIEIAKLVESKATELNFSEEFNWLKSILSWACEWNLLNNIVEVRTPICKFTYTNSNQKNLRMRVRLFSDNVPEGTPKGLVFPYNLKTNFAQQSAILQ